MNAISQLASMANLIQGVDVLSQSAEVEGQEITEFRTTIRVGLHPEQLASPHGARALFTRAPALLFRLGTYW
jgi:hypothetical protein